MKRVSLILAVLAVLGLTAPAFSAANSHYDNGNVLLSVGVGFAPYTVALFPGIEFVLGEFTFSEKYGLDWGVAVRGIFAFGNYSYFGTSYSWGELGAGAYFNLHWGMKGITDSFLDNLDFYWGPGVKFTVATGTAWGTSYAGFNFSTIGGVQYFFTEKFSVFIEGSYSGAGYGEVGFQLKL